MTTEFKEIIYPDGTTVYEAVNIDELNKLAADVPKTPELNLTPEQIAESILNQQKYEAREYLTSTDWYASRLAETGTAIPADVLERRQNARSLLSS
jgi:hypothetical protein